MEEQLEGQELVAAIKDLRDKAVEIQGMLNNPHPGIGGGLPRTVADRLKREFDSIYDILKEYDA